MNNKPKKKNENKFANKLFIFGLISFLIITAIQFALKDTVPSDMNNGVDFAYMLLAFAFPLMIPATLVGLSHGLQVNKPYYKYGSANVIFVVVTYLCLMFIQYYASHYLF